MTGQTGKHTDNKETMCKSAYVGDKEDDWHSFLFKTFNQGPTTKQQTNQP